MSLNQIELAEVKDVCSNKSEDPKQQRQLARN